MSGAPTSLTPDRYDARTFRFFAWYVGRLLRSSFHAVRLARASQDAADALAREPGPAIVALSHGSWWDPLLCVHLSQRLTPGRIALGPMDAVQLSRFGFMRRLGLFGVDPEDPAMRTPMVAHVERRMREAPRTTLWITPQGRFADVREEITLRPGAAAVAARLSAVGTCRVACLAIEMAFWNDKKPEVFLRLEACGAEEPASTASWHRALTRSMRQNAQALAAMVIARDPEPFLVLEGPRGARIHPVYDALLRLRGVPREIDQAGRTHRDAGDEPPMLRPQA